MVVLSPFFVNTVSILAFSDARSKTAFIFYSLKQATLLVFLGYFACLSL